MDNGEREQVVGGFEELLCVGADVEASRLAGGRASERTAKSWWPFRCLVRGLYGLHICISQLSGLYEYHARVPGVSFQVLGSGIGISYSRHCARATGHSFHCFQVPHDALQAICIRRLDVRAASSLSPLSACIPVPLFVLPLRPAQSLHCRPALPDISM